MVRGIPWKGKTGLLGAHNRKNIGLAVLACRALGVSEKEIKKGVESFKGVPGRLEFVREIRGVKYYNDTTATSPEGLYAALDALSEKRNRNSVISYFLPVAQIKVLNIVPWQSGCTSL